MRAWRKHLSVILCFCISLYTLPAFAFVAADEVDVIKIELSDHELGTAIGAGQLDATMADVRVGDTEISAVVVNRSTLIQARYSLDVVSIQGDIIENLDFGLLQVGEARKLTAQATRPLGVPNIDVQTTWVRVRVWNAGVPGFEAIDTASPG